MGAKGFGGGLPLRPAATLDVTLSNPDISETFSDDVAIRR
jgi:hypothetical protein